MRVWVCTTLAIGMLCVAVATTGAQTTTITPRTGLPSSTIHPRTGLPMTSPTQPRPCTRRRSSTCLMRYTADIGWIAWRLPAAAR